jgi:hypothetical protein
MHARRRRSGPLHQRHVDRAAPVSALDCSGNPQLPQCGRHHRYPRPAGHPRRSFRPARTLRAGGHRRRVRAQSHGPNGVPEITTAITHLRDVLGDQTYESLARKGETMTTAAMATYAHDQIDQARAELNAASAG